MLDQSSESSLSNTKQIPLKCAICDEPARGIYFGVLSCPSCKMFFRRNAEKKIQCYRNNQCKINITNRHICAACRLAKCFQCGMDMNLFRNPSSTKTRTKKSVQVTSLVKSYEPQMLPTLNILRADTSRLNNDEWTLLSNLVHSYDERKVLPVCESLYKDDESLQLMQPANETLIKQFFMLLYETTELCLRSNGDLRHLAYNDRLVLLRTGADSIACYGGVFSMYQFQLNICRSFLKALFRIYGEHSLYLTLNSIKFIDHDIVLNKIACLLLLFTRTTCIFSPTALSSDQMNTNVIFKIQNQYADVTWKYLLYRYGHCEAVQRFTNLIQSLLAVIQMMSQVQSVQSHVNDIERIVENTELEFILEDIEQFNDIITP
ncbi:unnamed protein product [Adineta ricciae]|uniref:Uncharacterized protein n=1 Tax=Adineta ricciae TaxID=249248 RepID=A0A815HUI9_ADIRI|nr:unnamed protein product [Adineta ricciae]CAF1441445.1 unnamed protein product [Adineta ricciae]